MKPILLKLAGLQSYREAQEVDFTRLCDSGVFGIFGPTGSGKSTILDAITLALYGKVERASGGTQGIMNQAESTLAVSFTFELSNASGTQKYTVERQFKRTGDTSMNGTVTRLIEATEAGSVVLADKAREVDAAVQDILGLSMADFTRAVVLPQGKFAEFLSLTGKDRRQMLQRLFRLEQYGDQLLARLSSENNRVKTEIGRIVSEQLGLGDASEQTLEHARGSVEQAVQASVEHSRVLQQEESAFAILKQAWEREQERSGLNKQWNELEQQRADMEEKERRLLQAERAEAVRPRFEEWQEASRVLQLRSAEEAEAEQRKAQAEAVRLRVRSELDARREKRASEEPVLELRIGDLKQAVSTESELQQWSEHASRMEKQLSEAQSALEASRNELAQETSKLERAFIKQAELKERMEKTEVSSDARMRIQSANSDRLELRALTKQLQEQTDAVAVIEAEQAQLQLRQEALYAQLHTIVQAAAHSNTALRRIQLEWKRGANILEELGSGLEACKLENDRLRTEQERRHTAALLAASLIEGEACPVCGSEHHPHPIQQAIESGQHIAADFEHTRTTAEALSTRVREMQLRLERGKFRMKQASSEVLKLQEQLQEGVQGAVLEQEEIEISAAEAAAAVELSALNEAVSIDHMVRRADTMELLLQQLDHALSAVEAAIDQAARDGATHSKLAQECSVRIHAGEQQNKQAMLKLSELRHRLEQVQEQWTSRYGEWTEEHVSQELARFQELDKEAEELRARLVKSEPFISGLQESIQRLKEQETSADKTVAQLAAELAANSRLVVARTELLFRLLYGPEAGAASDRHTPGIAAVELGKAETALAGLRTAEAEAMAAFDAAAAEWNSALQTSGLAAQALAAAREALDQAEQRLSRALTDAGFSGHAELHEALLPEESKQLWKQAAQQYRERERELSVRLKLLEEQLQGISLSEEDYSQAAARLQAAKQAHESALQLKAKAERDLEELHSKHSRWKSLDESRARLQERLNLLSKLSVVFRGNAFVEYVAEEQLGQICRSASERLAVLTRRRYALEVDSGGGFVIRDDANGGVRRPVSSLSGGETFLASLSLALALSAQIQLRGQYPLDFFFLDEGFGTLDPELLDTVVSALEKLHTDRLSVGVISHVPELRARLPRRLIVHPSQSLGSGSRVVLETM
jgi:DNA repair protein SbcC/Rad50